MPTTAKPRPAAPRLLPPLMYLARPTQLACLLYAAACLLALARVAWLAWRGLRR